MPERTVQQMVADRVARWRLRCCWAGGLLGLVALAAIADKVTDVWSYRPTPARLELGHQIFEHEWTAGDTLAATVWVRYSMHDRASSVTSKAVSVVRDPTTTTCWHSR